MKNLYLSIVEKKKYLAAVVLIIWSIFTAKMVILQFQEAARLFPKIFFLGLEQKYRIVDGSFYDFLRLCRTKIPEGAAILFKIIPEDPAFRSQDWFAAEYFIGKSPYYLYPRKVYRQEYLAPGPRYTIIYDTRSRAFGLYYK